MSVKERDHRRVGRPREPDEELEDTLGRRLRALLGEEGRAVRFHFERAEPLATLEDDGLVVAMKHPLAKAVDAAVLTGDPRAEAKARLLAARLLRGPDDASELAWIERLLR